MSNELLECNNNYNLHCISKSCNYLEYLLTEISKHQEATNLDFMKDLLPWLESLPVECRKSIVNK